MTFKAWWRGRSGKAKAITILAVLLFVQIGLCFQSEAVAPWVNATFHVTSLDVPMQALQLMLWQALFCVITIILLFLAGMGWLPKTRNKDLNEENNDR